VIPGIRRVVDKICAILGYTASSGNPLPTFRDNVPIPSSRVKKSEEEEEEEEEAEEKLLDL
jgi:hypothetical protein